MTLSEELILDINDFHPLFEKRLPHVLDIFSEGLFHVDSALQVTFYNPEFYQKFGIKSKTISVDEWLEYVHPLDRQSVSAAIERQVYSPEPNKIRNIQFRLRTTSRQYIWIETHSVLKFDGDEFFIVGRHCDVSEQKLFESYLQQAAYFDSASGMFNRAKLLADIELAQNTAEKHSLIYMQIDDIRTYVNQYGNEVVEHLISHVIAAVQVDSNDLVECYRARSDDFAIIVKGEHSKEELYTLCRSIYTDYTSAIQGHGHLYGENISIGVYPNFELNVSPEDIINIASRTCQFASEQEESWIAIYQGKTQSKVDRFFFVERGLKEALHSHSLSVKFQPIVDAVTGKVASFEALVRWKSKEFGEIYPDEFIPVAEKKGLINELGYQVFTKACQFITHYNHKNHVTVRVNVNVSVLQLLDRSFPEHIMRIATEYGIETKSIVLELTETVILDGNKNALIQLQKLSELGFRLSLDDFGTGFSSINSFFDLPLNQIKIDRTMACKTMHNFALNEYLEFIIHLCVQKGIDIVIEGIENSVMYQKFSELGASYLQGYWFSKPLSLASASYYTLSSNNLSAANQETPLTLVQ
ncbi:EAL domain-containing protein [Vibrio sp. CAIM 722]|uniref:EAL domain-containing protein n=1 Tax=Vibrio eleionomae TaxID=2653505 RepID=A0A7X4RWA1_9VIBR|nr:EAL domain-containing protein [Vibrio eleionomae]MZI95155.1 EAL domain-containing protein [Vibrio eleionomae]